MISHVFKTMKVTAAEYVDEYAQENSNQFMLTLGASKHLEIEQYEDQNRTNIV